MDPPVLHNLWHPRLHILDAHMGTQYVHSLFWATMATSGIGMDIIPTTELETTVTLLFSITGTWMIALQVSGSPRPP